MDWLRISGLAVTLLVFPVSATETNRMHQAQGSFAVTITPLPADDLGYSRMTLFKQFSGDLAGTSNGLMLSAGDPAKGEAGYVAIEVVAATLAGRAGGFALQHSGTMAAGGQQLAIAIVPGSGSSALAGISGSMTIRIEGRAHFYTLTYALPSAP